MTADIQIRAAGSADAGRLNEALERLSRDIGDDHATRAEDIRRHGFGPAPSFRALLAERDGAVVGAVVFSPIFSTTRAAPGLYVSDLWAALEARGAGLGRRLLAAARDAAAAEWGARFVKLVVYVDNPKATAFYERLGFHADQRETPMILDGAALDALEQER